ncbi:hypothetical protein Vretimale_5881 [Volvox reticuliferus]|uniref:Uncharacterized protein n=1 Tax=Volvox reticuliferus TaxID=1737510 RepID=A0A8J4G6L3_9CHLO|nr:hypothetical protein Vretifemale_5910 [Volvox reticuliferus]GIM01010.1 hypothetical protein Vretimale_5881 [Volvox reticuliferus]
MTAAQAFRHRAPTLLRTELAKNAILSDEILRGVVTCWCSNKSKACTGPEPLPANGGKHNADDTSRPKSRNTGVKNTSGSSRGKSPKVNGSQAVAALAAGFANLVVPQPFMSHSGLTWLLASASSLRGLHGAAISNRPMAATMVTEGLPSASPMMMNAVTNRTDINGKPDLTTRPKKRNKAEEQEILEQVHNCTDAEDLMDLLKSTVGVSETAISAGVHSSGRPSVSDSVVVEALLRLSTLPRSQPPPVSEEVQARRRRRRQRREAAAAAIATKDAGPLPPPPPVGADPAAPGSDEWWRYRRAVIVSLFRQLTPSYGTMDLTTRVALLEACSHLTWLLGHFSESKPARGGGDNDVSDAAAGDQRHPAQALLDAVLKRDGGSNLLVPASPQLLVRSCDVDGVDKPTPPSLASLAARLLASMGRLRYRDREALANLLPPLMTRRSNLTAADLACVVTAAAELRPLADPYVPWSHVCDGLAAPGALPQLTAEELVRLAQALAGTGAIRSDGGKGRGSGRDPDSDSDVESLLPSYHEEDGDDLIEYGVSSSRGDRGGNGVPSGGRGYDVAYGAPERAGEWTGADAEERLLAALGREVSERARLGGGGLSGGQVVRLMVAAARLGLRDTEILQPLAAAARRHLPFLRPDEVSQLMCATARLGFVDPALIDAVSYTVSAIQSTDPMSYNVRSLAIVSWALACHGRPCPDLFSDNTATALINGMRITPMSLTPSSTPSSNLPPPSHLTRPPPQPPSQATPTSRSLSGKGPSGAQQEVEAAAALVQPDPQQQLRLRPYEVANSLWAFARQNARHRGLTLAAMRRCADWQRRGRLPRSSLVKVLWAATKMGYTPGADGGADSGGWRRRREEVAPGLGGGGEYDDAHSDALLLAERVAELVIGQAQRFTGPELVQAAEALEPYCTAGGPLYDKYGRDVYQRLMEVARSRVASLRPDACVALLSTLSRATAASGGLDRTSPSVPASSPPLPSLDSRLLLRAQQRLMGPMESGQLSIAQLLEVMEVLRRADARNAPSLPGLEQQLLRLVGEADEGDDDGGVVAARAPPLSGEQAVAALVNLGSLQRHGAAAELFRLTHRQVTSSLEQQSPEGIARLLRLLGAAALRGRRQTAAEVAAAMMPAPSGARNKSNRVAGWQHQPQPLRQEMQAAVAMTVLGSGLVTFLDAAWVSMQRPGGFERLSTSQLVDAVWGLAACGYDEPRAYDELATRLQGRVKNLPAWSLARIAAAMHGHGLNDNSSTPKTTATAIATAVSGACRSRGGSSPPPPQPAGLATTQHDGKGGGGRPPSHLERHPELAERIAKYGTRELTRLGSGAKPQDLATLVEVFASAAPQYGGLFLAAAHRARRWLKEAAELEEGGGARTGGGTDDGEGGGGQAGDLREAVIRVRAACEAAGYDVSEVLGSASEPARNVGSTDGAERGKGRGVRTSGRLRKVYGGAPASLREGWEPPRGLGSPRRSQQQELADSWAPGPGSGGGERARRRRADDRRVEDLSW